jgi:ubiquinone/menaquinone biosynthesis C-methylase UbiE
MRPVENDDGSTMDVHDSVRRRFGAVAASYATSAVHAGGADLEAMLEAAALQGTERVLDVAAGAGHTTLAFAPRVASVVAVDLTEPMLAEGRRLAAERGIGNVTFTLGDAEHLPAPDGTFDLVTCRYAAHHFPRPAAAAREWARVLAPGGRLVLVDVVAPDDPATDTVLNAAEVLRDPSHVRDHTVGEWLTMLEAAGFAAEEKGRFPLRLEFASWVERMRTPPAMAAQIRALFAAAPASVREALQVEDDGTFTVPVALLRGRRGG